MAARKRQNLSEKTKARISASMLINRLNNHIAGKIELSPTQIQAAKILINKVVPDLKQIEHSYNQETPLKIDAKISPTDAYLKMLRGK